MPCTTQKDLTPTQRERMQEAIQRLERALTGGTVRVSIGANGALAFKGIWRSDGVADLCAYRALTAAGSAALRKAIARAEVTAGRPLNLQAVNAGTHSHDGGSTWHNGH